ncbi:MAG: DM13 domain-containing protein [SAR202 cluster bacterium]|jgi:hypothetical protein|nr:DM13 domain-containing protein [SAR202 cluster bacterium]MDP6514976.1 DM13 domain-containing protein [SAR202 cluster bacterium]MDP6713003.1 DM13 domain-containing protein [SAR202 cluster bacterium]
MKLPSRKVFAITGAVILIPVLALGWWLLSPLFLNKLVEEEFPFAFSASVPDDMTMGEIETIMSGIAKMDAPAESESAGAMAGAEVTRSGEFTDADRFHKGSGDGTIYTLSDGSTLLRLEDFRVTNGPDLRVILSPNPNPQNSSEVLEDGYIEVGKLKGNIGNQNYPLPAGIDPLTFNSVVIYCKPFKVVFSVASLSY